ncbi:replicative DNA helicase [Peredibacter starrii]|uniref:Replicative DNA helicase n=1 Tax=Peredibacter starrii TaxID=28202 RepID=A0AAX4HMJ6_9BACT|nr:replicative DNA helicase [Peredibacter starrii]WPU64426.1 replicative DNA helicase [Peredibacter starrii]
MAGPNELPHDLSAEKALLGCLLIDNSSFDEISDVNLMPDDFYHPQYGIIFSVIKDLHMESMPFDIVTVSSKLNDHGKLEKVGGQGALVAICDEIGSAANVEYYAQMIKEKSMLREVVRTATRVMQTGTNFTGNVADFMQEVEAGFFKLTAQTKNNKMIPLKQALYENLKELEKPARAKGEIMGVSTGFGSIDRSLLGLQPGQLVLIAARPGMGKTAFALNWAVAAAKQTNMAVAVFSYEMMYAELSMRLLSSEAGVDSRKLKTKEFNEMDLRQISNAVQKLSNLKLYINDSGATNLMDIRSYCRKLKAEQGLAMIIVDYLQIMPMHVKKQNREQEIAELSRGFKMLANELEIPVVALSQLNRTAASRTDRRPQLQDLRESGSLEQDANIVCLIHREDYYDPQTPKKGIAEIIIAKNRNGEPGTVELAWIGSQTKFADLAPQKTEQ